MPDDLPLGEADRPLTFNDAGWPACGECLAHVAQYSGIIREACASCAIDDGRTIAEAFRDYCRGFHERHRRLRRQP